MKKFLVVIAVILALGAAGFWVGRPAYRDWKQERLIKQARESLRRGDLRSAGLNARQALKVNGDNLEACRIMADITESFRSPAALDWRQRLVRLQPDSLTNRLDLARCGILFGDYSKAAWALQGVDATNQNTAAFHQMAAMVAMSLNNIAAAERHFSEAVRLDPGNKLLELNRAIIHLQAKDQKVVAGALKSLEQLYADPAYRKDALRHLAMAASRHKDYDKALVFTRELQSDPAATLGDKLLHLGVLQDSGNAAFGGYLTELEGFCAKDPERVNTLTAWLLAHDQVRKAGEWLAGLPAELQAARPVVLARADHYMAEKDWTGLQTLLQEGQWGELDFLRQGMLARAYRGLGQEYASQNAWRAALREASEHSKQLGALARMASRWEWDAEKEDVLWMLVQRFPAERWALQSLTQFYLETGNTRGLQKAYSTQAGYDANDLAARNNLAAVSLLLNQHTNEAFQMAREAYLKATNNTAFASTYAWSLHLQGRTAEGLAVLDALKPERLESPGVALYYGIMQAAVRAPDKAKKYLALAESGQLLPEEKSLLEAAKKGL